MPAPVYFDGQRLPARANFYIATRSDHATFMTRTIASALNTVAGLFPEREVVESRAAISCWVWGPCTA